MVTRLDRFMRWLAPLAAIGAVIAVASVFLLAPYDRWFHLAELAAFLGAIAGAALFRAGGNRWRGITARVAGGLFLGGVFLMLLPLTCGG